MNQRAEGEAQQTKRMSLLLTLSPTSLDRDRGDAQRQSAVDPVAVVDGQDELIGNPVELARIMRDLVRVEKVERDGWDRLLTEQPAPVNTRRVLSNRRWSSGPRVCRCDRASANASSLTQTLWHRLLLGQVGDRGTDSCSATAEDINLAIDRWVPFLVIAAPFCHNTVPALITRSAIAKASMGDE